MTDVEGAYQNARCGVVVPGDLNLTLTLTLTLRWAQRLALRCQGPSRQHSPSP